MREKSAPGPFFAWISLCLSCLFTSQLLAQEWAIVRHQDARQTIKYQFYPPMPQRLLTTDPLATAFAYLRMQAADYGLSRDLYGIKLHKQQESLLGYHLRFQQEQNGLAIEGAEIIVSILRADSRIYQVYSNVQPRQMTVAKNLPQLSLEEAYDRAWNFLGVQGNLFEAPVGVLQYVTEADALRAAFRIELSTTAPYGAWKVYVDAETGKIIRYEDQRISHKPWAARELLLGKGPTSNRLAAFALWKKASEKALLNTAVTPANGGAKLFDPDPRTSLADRGLLDNSPDDSFQDAYFQRELKDISYDGSTYKLEGPWVKILDWDPPTAAPSTSTNGQWNFARGNNAFNDAMTYYHLDKSQRYMQSLGFTGNRGIQYAPIEVDSNGVNGDDNSYFQPGTNRLSFGHGCVDDNEDADVILHEYGHAIHFSINPSWGGGDTGAIGEGFGDYWAASYSLSTTNGAQFYPNEVYSWDGHGEGNVCWQGRILNALEARYDSTQTYRAHAPIPGGFQTDELWSTPLFQSLLTLKSMGVPREEVDTIILQAQFGLGSNLSMRDMAQSIIVTAQQLYNGPHSKVFKDNFLRHGIIEEPRAILTSRLDTVKDAGSDGIVDPGEEVDINFILSNSGTLAASQIQASLSNSDSLATVVQGATTFPDLDLGKSASGKESLRLRINPSTACGTLVKFELSVSYNEQTKVFPLEIRVGQPVGIAAKSTPRLSIPDADSKGVLDSVEVRSSGLVSKQFKLGVDVRHPYRGDLKLILISPSGKQLVLHDRTGISEDDLIGTYPTTLVPKESLEKILGEPISGRWQLQVADLASSDIGTFQAWSIEDITSYQCQGSTEL